MKNQETAYERMTELQRQQFNEEIFGADRLAQARTLEPSPDVWTTNASDMLKVATLAGHNVQEIMLACFRKAKGEKINSASVEREMRLDR